jgi:hypothetical protein
MEDAMRIAALFAPLLVAGSLMPASAQDRYTLERSGDNFVRMDRQTGEMSVCTEKSGQLVCKLAADERSAFEADVDRMGETIAALDKRIAALENSLAARLESKLPTDEEFERTLTYMERFLRGFIGIARDLEKDTGEGSATLAPDKT